MTDETTDETIPEFAIGTLMFLTDHTHSYTILGEGYMPPPMMPKAFALSRMPVEELPEGQPITIDPALLKPGSVPLPPYCAMTIEQARQLRADLFGGGNPLWDYDIWQEGITVGGRTLHEDPCIEVWHVWHANRHKAPVEVILPLCLESVVIDLSPADCRDFARAMIAHAQAEGVFLA